MSVCKLYDDILYILLSKILYDVTSSSSTSSLGIMSYTLVLLLSIGIQILEIPICQKNSHVSSAQDK